MKISNETDFFLWIKEYSGFDFSVLWYKIRERKIIYMKCLYKTKSYYVCFYILLNINDPQDFTMQLSYPDRNSEFQDIIHDKIAEWSASLKDKYIIHQLSI